MCFPVNFAEFLRIFFSWTLSDDCALFLHTILGACLKSAIYINPQTVFEHSNGLVILLLVLLDIYICDALHDLISLAQF